MALVTTKKMFEKAFEGGYAIGAFNINNMEIIQGVVAAAKAQNSAVILQVSKSALKYAHPKYLKAMVDAAIEETDLDIALHLDHGSDFEVCKDCIEYGFTSVMFDGSHLEYEENVAQTKKIVEYAHERGIVVEAELGKLAGVEDEVNVDAAHATYTDPDQAVDFVKRTGVDSLAIAIGTSHGAYKFKGEAKLDFDRLATITESWRRQASITTPSFCTVHPLLTRDVLRCATNTAEILQAQKGFLRKCCARHLPWLSAKSTWILT